ncbi:Oligopeptide transporter 1 [Vitis vinifera]|uniref:Oligopeptide transporter 1 n=1 Tax=Vitis vinifera TaxID=29760 RepID=A0A438ERF3_VITVI|nr:Oligopeptide transporter 1 [Vitis vinifera]
MAEPQGDNQLKPPEMQHLDIEVTGTDDTTEPVLTFRTWVLGMLACVTLSFVNQFFAYRRNQLSITSFPAQIVTLPLEVYGCNAPN